MNFMVLQKYKGRAKVLKCPNFRADSGSYDLKVNRNGQNFEN